MILQKVATSSQVAQSQQHQHQTNELAQNSQTSDQSTSAGGATGAMSQQQQSSQQQGPGQQQQQHHQPMNALKYMVMAGTAEKMLEHLLETRIDGHTQIGPLSTSGKSSLLQCQGDNFLEDFILTHRIFMSTGQLCHELLKQYQAPVSSSIRRDPIGDENNPQQQQQNRDANQEALEDQYLTAKKRRVIKFIRCWMLIAREHFFQQTQIQTFLTVSTYIEIFSTYLDTYIL